MCVWREGTGGARGAKRDRRPRTVISLNSCYILEQCGHATNRTQLLHVYYMSVTLETKLELYRKVITHICCLYDKKSFSITY